MAFRKKISTDATFSIANLIDKSNIYQDNYFKIGDELREFNNVSLQPEPEIWRASENDVTGGASTKYQKEWKQQQQQQQQRQ